MRYRNDIIKILEMKITGDYFVDNPEEFIADFEALTGSLIKEEDFPYKLPNCMVFIQEPLFEMDVGC